jgi:hypothetical protein
VAETFSADWQVNQQRNEIHHGFWKIAGFLAGFFLLGVVSRG